MARKTKRKAPGSQNILGSPSKRRKTQRQTSSAEDKTYPCEVLSESRNGDLLIHWWPDSQTGEIYDRTWISRSDAVPGLLEDWKIWKRNHPGQRSRSDESVERLIERGPQSFPDSSLDQPASASAADALSESSQPVLDRKSRSRIRNRRRAISSSEEEPVSEILVQRVRTPRVGQGVGVLIREDSPLRKPSDHGSTQTVQTDDQIEVHSDPSGPPLSQRVILDSQSLTCAGRSSQNLASSSCGTSQLSQRRHSSHNTPALGHDHFRQISAPPILGTSSKAVGSKHSSNVDEYSRLNCLSLTHDINSNHSTRACGPTHQETQREETSHRQAVARQSAVVDSVDFVSILRSGHSVEATTTKDSAVYLQVPLYSQSQEQLGSSQKNLQRSQITLWHTQTHDLQHDRPEGLLGKQNSPSRLKNLDRDSTISQDLSVPQQNKSASSNAVDYDQQKNLHSSLEIVAGPTSSSRSRSGLTSDPSKVHIRAQSSSDGPTLSTQISLSSSASQVRPSKGIQQHTAVQVPAQRQTSSGSLPHAPSHSLLGIQDSKMPSRPQTPTPASSETMSPSGKISFSDRRRMARQARDAKLAVGMAERAAANTAKHVNNDGKLTKTGTPVTTSPDARSTLDAATTEQTTAIPYAQAQNDVSYPSWDLVLPLPLPDISYDSYNSSFQYHYQQGGLLDELWNYDEPHHRPDFLQDIQDLLHNMCRHTLHLDLIDDQQVSQYPMTASAEYAASVSSKFAFLWSLLRAARDLAKHIIIFVENGKPLQTTYRFLQDSGITHSCPDLQKSTNKDSALTITLLGSSDLSRDAAPDEMFKLRLPDLIIGMDNSFTFESKLVQSIRNSRHTPAIKLMVPYSMEHVVPDLRKTWTLAALRNSFSLAAQIRHLAGRPGAGLETSNGIGQQVANVLVSDAQGSGALPNIDVHPLPAMLPQKRAAEHQLESSRSPKRTRDNTLMSGPVSSDEPANETTRVTDSTAHKSSTANEVPDSASSADLAIGPNTLRVKEKIETLKTVIRALEPQNHELWAECNTLRKRLNSQEELHVQISTLKASNLAARETADALRLELVKVNELLAGSETPELQDLHDHQERKREVAMLTQKVGKVEQERETFMRMYTDMREVADSRGSVINTMTAEHARLVAMASGEALRLRQSFHDTNLALTRDELARTKEQLAVTDRAFHKQSDDVTNLREENERLHSRLGSALTTRGSVRTNSPAASTLSVPGQGRSSRAGTPSGAFSASPAASRAGSRQGTPQPGIQGHKPKGPIISFSNHRSLLRE